MTFDPQKHHRRSIRLSGYDYTQAGAYFITLVTCQRACLFGEIQDGEMQLSALGKIADENWRAIPDHFPQAQLGAYVVMPNHLHGIIILGHDMSCPNVPQQPASTEQFQKPVPGSIPTMIRAYKASVTQRYRQQCPGAQIWQKNYYEHIIRNDEEHQKIHLYIEANIANWINDKEYTL